MCQDEIRLETVDLATSDDEYIDDNYTDQENVLGEDNDDDVFTCGALFNKFASGHQNFQVRAQPGDGAKLCRLSEALDLDTARSMSYFVEVEQYTEYPSAASFPKDDVMIPMYDYNLVQKRKLSLSSPDICDDQGSNSAWQVWGGRCWNWGRVFRRRR